MSKNLDIAELRMKLRVYDNTLPRCQKRIVREWNDAPSGTPKEEVGTWDMRVSSPCGELEGHEGQCREGRAILGWPGFATLTALLDEVERLRENADARERVMRREADLLRAAQREVDELRAVYASLRQTSGDLCVVCGWRFFVPDVGCQGCEVERLQTENTELRECLRWYVENDDTNEGGKWEESNAPWLEGKRRAMKMLGVEP